MNNMNLFQQFIYYFQQNGGYVFQLLQKQYPSCKGMKPIYPVYPETLRIVEVKE
nr:hypothetical protein [Enterococcus faecalis]